MLLGSFKAGRTSLKIGLRTTSQKQQAATVGKSALLSGVKASMAATVGNDGSISDIFGTVARRPSFSNGENLSQSRRQIWQPSWLAASMRYG